MDFVERGQAMVARGQYQEAVKTCRLGLLANPTNVDGRLVLGRALVALRRYDEVLAEMRVALEVEPSNAHALSLRGEALLRKGDSLQAIDILRQAALADPGDRHIAVLLSEAELASASRAGRHRAPPSFGAPADSMTKHYPAHRGVAGAPPGSGSVTKPTVAGLPGYDEPTTDELAVGDRSGTMEIDPELDEVEVLDDDLDDPPIDPPSPATPLRPALLARTEDSEVMELSSSDLMAEAASGKRGSRPHLAQSAADEPTASYRRDRLGIDVPGDFGEDAPTVARDEDFASAGARGFGTGLGTTPESPRSRPLGVAASGPQRPDASALQRSAAAIDELFEGDDETGVSSLEVLAEEDGGPVRSQSEDMRVIRAGLGLDPTTSGNKQSPLRRNPPATRVPAAMPAVAKRPPSEDRYDATQTVGRRRKRSPSPVAPAVLKGKGKRKKVPMADRTLGVRKARKRSPLVWLYLVLAIAVGAGSVFVGLRWREQRRSEQVDAARRTADKIARKDTYDAYLEAARIYREIVEIDDDDDTRAALARMNGAIAAEFGAERAAVKAEVKALGDASSADAIAARAYDAIAHADGDGAKRFADQLTATYADDAMAPYLEGRALLLLDQPDKAAEAFRDALRSAPRPIVLVGLGLAEEARGGSYQAIAAFDRAIDLIANHPWAVIHRARVAARSGQLRDGKEPETTLLALIDDSSDNVVSPEQKAWASLSLAEVELARGDVKGAAKALDRARASRPPSSWQFTEALIRGLLRVGRSDDARAETERAVEQFADRGEPRVFQAQVALDGHDAKAALAALEKAGDISKNAEALAIRGQAQLQLDALEEARADLEAALALKPELRAAQAARGQLLLRTGNAKAAAEELSKIYNDNASLPVALTYAAALREIGDKLEARSVLQALAKRSAGNARVYLEQARLERADGKMREAREFYSKAIQAAPTDIEPRVEAALLALDTGDRKGAREAFEALVADAPDNGTVLLSAARVYSMTGAFDKAGELIDRADKAGAPRWRLARERGRMYIKGGLFEKAVEPLEQAVSLEPGDGESRLLLLDAHLYRGKEEDARRVLRDILKTFPNDAEAQLANGRIALYKERYVEAADAFKKARTRLDARRASPRELGDAAQWLGRVYYFDDKLLNARKKLTEAVALDPGHAEAFYFLGLVELDNRRFKAATEAFRQSVAADPTSTPDAWFYLGEAAYNSRKWTTSKNAFNEYLKLRPKGELAPDARKMLRRLR